MVQPPEKPATDFGNKIIYFPSVSTSKTAPELRNLFAAYWEHFDQQHKHDAQMALLLLACILAILSSSALVYPLLYQLSRENTKRRYHKTQAEHYLSLTGQNADKPEPPDILA